MQLLLLLLGVAGLLAAGFAALNGKISWPWVLPLLALVAFLGWREWERHRELQAYSAVASELAGHPSEVSCQRRTDPSAAVGVYEGYVPYPSNPEELPTRAELSPNTCAALKSYREEQADPTRDEVAAVHVLTHESMHLKNLRGEAEAECAAVQRDSRTAELLGASEEEARSLAEAYYRDFYPDLPSSYRSGKCVKDGEWDEHLGLGPW